MGAREPVKVHSIERRNFVSGDENFALVSSNTNNLSQSFPEVLREKSIF